MRFGRFTGTELSQPQKRDWTGCYGRPHQAVSRVGLGHVSTSCEAWVMWGQGCEPVGRQVLGANLDSKGALGWVLRDSLCSEQRALETRPHKPGTETPTPNTPASSWGFGPALLSLQHFCCETRKASCKVAPCGALLRRGRVRLHPECQGRAHDGLFWSLSFPVCEWSAGTLAPALSQGAFLGP